MKPQYIAFIFAIFSMCSAPAHAELVDGMVGKWKAAGAATIFEVFPDGRYESTVNGAVIETGKMNATNGTWNIRANSGRVDQGSFTLNGSELQLKGALITTAWSRISNPTSSTTSTTTTVSAGSSATATTSAGSSTTSSSATTATNAGSNTKHLSDKEKAIERFKAKYGARSGGWIQSPPGGHMNDQQARKFWRGH